MSAFDRLTKVAHWKMHGYSLRGKQCSSISGWAHIRIAELPYVRCVSAAVRLKAGESIEDMVRRFADVIDDRLEHGMPKTRPSKREKPRCAVCDGTTELRKFGEFYLCATCDVPDSEVKA